MKKQILKYTIRVNKKFNEIEIFIRDYPACGCEFTCVSKEGHSAANHLYYSHNTRPATNEEISKANSKVVNDFLNLYSDDYELQYLKRLPR